MALQFQRKIPELDEDEIQDIKDAIDDQHKNFYLFSSTKDELITIKDKYKK